MTELDPAAVARTEQLMAEMVSKGVAAVDATHLAVIGAPPDFDNGERHLIQAAVRSGVMAAMAVLIQRGLLHGDEL